MPRTWRAGGLPYGDAHQDDMPKRWRIHPHQSERITALERSARVPTALARLLICRGLGDPQAALDFLDPKMSSLRDPESLPGAVDAAGRIARSIEAKERIVVYGDYDVDGMSATAILWQCLRMLGADVRYYVPHRLTEGYGLNSEAIDALALQGARLIVTVDCGVASLNEAAHARKLGLGLVVTDHHQLADRLPDADSVVHPALPPYPFAGLAGAGVAFKVAWALCQQAAGAKRVGERMKNFLLSALGLAALGTIADVVPLIDENRVLVQHGLASLKDRPGVGLAALMRVAGVADKERLGSEDVAFALAPRLNAAGRLCQAQLAVELLTTDSAERAQMLAEYVHQLNDSRQSLERSIYLAANKQAQQQLDAGQDAALVLADRGWHAGVIGIVAGRLAEKFHRPVVMIALDESGVKPGVGSARSIPGLDVNSALAACAEHLESCGGHAAAAGLRIAENRVDAFRSEFCEHVAGMLSDAMLAPELAIDAEVSLAELTREAVEQIERLAPFGHANPRPLLCASRIRLEEPPKRIGGGGRHLSLRVVQHRTAMRGVAFGGGDWADDLAAVDGELDIAFRPVINEFRGRRNVELQLVDWRVCELADAART